MSPSYTDWPKRDDRREQPWADPDASQITPRAGLPLLAAGVQHPMVHVLFTALGQLGYETPVTRGENPFGTVGPEEMAAVRQFRRDYGVREDPTAFGGHNPDSEATAENHIGPWTGEAILRAAAATDDGDAASDAGAGELAQLRAQVDKLAGDVVELKKSRRSLEEKIKRLQARKPAAGRSASKG